VDVYVPGPGAQLDDMNPSLSPPFGLFWTIAIPPGGISFNLSAGRASMVADDVPIYDYADFASALSGSSGVKGTVSFKVAWSGVTERLDIRNDDSVYGGFEGSFILNSAQMEWSAKVGDLEFKSDPLDTSSSSFAEIGQERNGVFFS
jgi:hypothetical protein